MPRVEVILPKVDMDMESGVIVAWKVVDGEFVNEGDILFEMETSKSMMEVEAPGTGVIRDLANITGESISVGTTVAWIHPADDDSAPLSPDPAPAGIPPLPAVFPPADASSGADHLEPLSPTRRLVAERLSESARTAPHFYVTMQVDMTALLRSRGAAGNTAAPKSSITVAIAGIVARTLMNHPRINASLEGDALRRHTAVHIGIAMDRAGDLIVPVLRNAHMRTLAELAQDFARLRDAVDGRTVTPADLRGSTFTISNLGMYGVDAFTAIINPPESAILAIGRATDTPVVRDGAIVIRTVATMSLSSDHRVIDGATAARFMADVRAAIEAPDVHL
ncbi:MAG: dihydrolipoamide acetyltransferase family protein [Casimicrobiaceae bacterium]